MSEDSARWDAEGVRRLRERLGMTQQQLAAALGVRQQTVSEWETGAYQPRGASRRMLRHVAEAGARYDAGPDGADDGVREPAPDESAGDGASSRRAQRE